MSISLNSAKVKSKKDKVIQKSYKRHSLRILSGYANFTVVVVEMPECLELVPI